MFFVLPPGAYTNKSEGFPTRDQATYSCPCAKLGFSKFSPHTCSEWMYINQTNPMAGIPQDSSGRAVFVWIEQCVFQSCLPLLEGFRRTGLSNAYSSGFQSCLPLLEGFTRTCLSNAYPSGFQSCFPLLICCRSS
jgi:hypothetical protein